MITTHQAWNPGETEIDSYRDLPTDRLKAEYNRDDSELQAVIAGFIADDIIQDLLGGAFSSVKK